MASESEHLSVANRNHETLLALCRQGLRQHGPWIATIAFYKALHVMEAAASCQTPPVHNNDHATRDSFFKTATRFSHAYKFYRPLRQASEIARYLTDPRGSSSAVMFDYAITPQELVLKYLLHHLHQVEESCIQFLQTPSALSRIAAHTTELKELLGKATTTT